MLSRTALKSPNARVSLGRAFATELATSTSKAVSELPSQSRLKKPRTVIATSVILNRSPILTRTPTLFEQAFYAYQARIRRALHNPFPYDFYFKQGSLLETRFNMEERKRERQAFGPNFVSDDVVDPEKAAADKAAVEQLALQEGEGEELMPRKHAADLSDDFKSLDRRGKRNLYLLLQVEEDGNSVWRFPEGGIEQADFLHQAAQKDLHAECGSHMDTWIVGRCPIGVYKRSPKSTAEPEQTVFFFKGQIMAGQAQTHGESVKDFAWLTKEEIEKHVEKDYWDGVKDILSDY
ncbi:mitochondrial 54S ribosomal protein YmL17/YmL30 [Laccaria bicolor S238N-H82]|uniref:Large ribosomal subunit protein mL46 n=1 Tax=Laccaria bicolor (strain S238N-H82 / ATCC MYA-4686) TaxID=486041 RepID=B0D3Z0_LACBS|nr:mitochondrial 54S ribosomal protein YmL17/YmL30 [Laccaria bicolor S238N-H82]EDR11349.1 predicted protein [Laccaria bicolor S238N-H82]|eukprot:XP_001878650.1 mitochondrial 54S ribosomal protein YmL17/YmL30 [Laccaria bicolor S238N-H82]